MCRVLLALGAAAAATILKMESEFERLSALKAYLLEGIRSQMSVFQVNGAMNQTSPHVVSLTFSRGRWRDDCSSLLNKNGLAVSMGSACNARETLPSHVLKAMGLTPALADATIRVSFGYPTTRDDVNRLLDVLPGVVEQCRKIQ